jgi:cob(I)alamin adenosyltransferase
MKVYTKTGDGGKTALLGGTRVSKGHVRIEAYGSVDELNSWLGVLAEHSEGPRKGLLMLVQRRLFTVGSELAADPAKPRIKIPHITQEDIEVLETAIDAMEAVLPPLKAFVLPGGHPVAAFAHVARTVCRRSERSIVVLAEQEEIPELVLPYINRLSDYLFVLSRAIVHEQGGQDVEWHAH